MKIASNIKFDKLATQQVFDSTTSEYKSLDKLNDNGEWKEYVNDRLAAGISVVYDATGDYFAVKPLGFKPEKTQQNENSNRMSTKKLNSTKVLKEGSYDDFLENNMSRIVACKKLLNKIAKVLDTEDTNVWARVEKALSPYDRAIQEFVTNHDGSVSASEIVRVASDNESRTGTEKQMILNAIEDAASALRIYESISKKQAMKKSLKEDEDKYLLFDDEDPDKDEEDLEGDDEAEVLPGKDDVDVDIESPTTDLTSIDSDDEDIEVADVAPAVEENTGGISVEDIQRIVDEMLNQRVGSTINSDVEETVPTNDALANSGSTVTDNITGVFDAASSSDFAEVQDRLGVVKDKIENDASYADILNGDEGQDLESVGGDDLDTMVSNVVTDDSEESIGVPLEDDYSDEPIGGNTLPPAEYIDEEVEAYEPPVTDEVTSYEWEPITITIKGWIISQSEVNSLAESVKKSGGKLKKIGSPNKSELYLFVEAAGKKYKIKY